MMKDDSVSEPEKPPSSVVISVPLVQKDPEQRSIQQQPEVILIQAPKFNHPARTISSIVTCLAIFIFLISFFSFSSSTGYDGFSHLEFGFQSCCFLFNVAFILEIVYYGNLITHNNTYGEDNTWPTLNLFLALVLAGIGLLIFLTNFF
tara:strand:- start:245 stop:688 length:444 start_codon:yes stop_codon:yes gene_type:complete